MDGSASELGVCEVCGHVGPRDEFYSNSKRFCTAACSHSFSAKHRFNSKTSAKASSDAKAKSLDSKTKKNGPPFVLPSESRRHQCISMGFNWGTYLSSKKSIAASVELFSHSPMSPYWGDIGNGMKLEVLNLDCNLTTDVYWIASVVQIAGYKAKLRYEGFGEDGSCDFWCNLCTLDVNAVGWCATIGKPLVPPQTIQHKYSNWKSFLVKKLTGAKTLPNDFQKRITDSVTSPFLCGLRLEVVDKTRISRMRVGIVNEVVGGRLRLKYEDSDYENDDFWCHSQSALIHPIGWCERVGHKILVSSKDYKQKKGCTNARPDLFAAVKNVKSCGFRVNMKLEAIDPLNLSSICVATVKKVLKNGYLMIGIDGSEAADGSDWFCYHCTSPSIFPVGFCMKNKISLSVPTRFKDNFSWAQYLVDTNSQAAPVELFENKVPDHGFKSGMKLEAVDLMEPRLLCVATVTKVVGRLLHVHFDGWENQYDQWVDCESPDIYPVGWCELVGYDLQPPPNLVQPVDQNISLKKKKVKGQSFITKKKRKKPVSVPKKFIPDPKHEEESTSEPHSDQITLAALSVGTKKSENRAVASTNSLNSRTDLPVDNSSPDETLEQPSPKKSKGVAVTEADENAMASKKDSDRNGDPSQSSDSVSEVSEKLCDEKSSVSNEEISMRVDTLQES